MKKKIFAMMALAAALCACTKEQLFDVEQVEKIASPLIFTATMEDSPSSKATFDNTAECASWEIGDKIAVNGAIGQALSAGTSTTFTIFKTEEIRPTYIGTSDQGCYGDNPASNLVDDGGTSTRWCVATDQKGLIADYWSISVSTGLPTVLKTIKLWNAGNTASYPNRVWKDIKVLGRLSSVGGDYTTIKTIYNLNLVANNSGLAGEIDIDATVPYDQYRIIIYNNMGDDYMQMADMKFVVSYPEVESPYTAYFPAELYNGGQAALPKTVTETWADGKFNMPMYAKSSNTDLQFKNLCGVLKIIVKSDQISAVKKIRVSSKNKAISGAFTIDANNAAVLTDASTVANTLTVTYTEAVNTDETGKVFYVAVPAQTYQELKIELSADGTNFIRTMATKSETDITVERNKIYSISYNGVGVLPAGALPGEFRVSDSKKVYFSKGNLQAKYDGSNYTWSFAENQYDFIGNAEGNTTIDNQVSGNVVDLFGWSTGATNFGISTSIAIHGYSGDFVDWGKNIGNGNTWHTLSKDEWVYLFNTRSVNGGTGEGYSYSRGITYGGKKGLVLYPDDYTGDELISKNTKYSELPDGVVFLPYAAHREGSTTSSFDTGYYWTSTPDIYTFVYRVHFDDYYGFCACYEHRNYGHSVRLVSKSR